MNSAISGAATGAAVSGGNPYAAAAGGIGGLLLGQDDNSGDYYKDLLNQAQQIPLPVLKEYYPDLYKQVVQLNPQLETAEQLGPTAMGGITQDPRLQQAQMGALEELQNISKSGGITAQDKARLNQIQNETNTNLQGQTGAIQQNLATRGMGGGMSEMVARQIQAQGAANRQADEGLDVNAQAQQRALDALMNGAQLGGSMQNADFQRQSDIAKSKDLINQFNTQNKQQVQSRNVGSQNEAQGWNAQNAQNVANQNTGLSNTAQQYNANLGQQQFQNQLAKYGLQSGATQGAAQAAANSANQNNQFLGNAMTGAAYAFGNKPKEEDPLKKKVGY